MVDGRSYVTNVNQGHQSEESQALSDESRSRLFKTVWRLVCHLRNSSGSNKIKLVNYSLQIYLMALIKYIDTLLCNFIMIKEFKI